MITINKEGYGDDLIPVKTYSVFSRSKFNGIGVAEFYSKKDAQNFAKMYESFMGRMSGAYAKTHMGIEESHGYVNEDQIQLLKGIGVKFEFR